MDLPVPLWTLPVIAFGAILIILYYKFRLEPLVQLPFPNEEDLGIGKIHLRKSGRFNEGRITTATKTVKDSFSKLITNAEEQMRERYITLRDAMMERYLIGQRVGRDRIIYLFDENPLDPNYCVREDKGGKVPIRTIGPVQDEESYGVVDGIEYISGKLVKEQHKFTEQERAHETVLRSACADLHLAAINTEAVKRYKDDYEAQKKINEKTREELAEMTAKCDRAVSALSQHGLSEGMQPKIPSGLGQKLKEWFTWPQLVTAAAFYFIVSPIVMSISFPTATPPTTTYITAFIAVIGFLIIPVFKKLFGRWL